MTREHLVEEKRRLISVQKSLLSASRGAHDPATSALIDAVAQLTLTVDRLLKEKQE